MSSSNPELARHAVFQAAKKITKKMTEAQAREVLRSAYKVPDRIYGRSLAGYEKAWNDAVEECSEGTPTTPPMGEEMSATSYRDFRGVLDRVKFRDWLFWTVLHKVGSTEYHYLQVEFNAPDSTPADQGGESTRQKGRKWILSEHMTDGEIVQTAFMAVIAAMEHEVREEFTYRGHAIFGPHYDLEVLVAVCETKHNDVRRAPVGDPDHWLAEPRGLDGLTDKEREKARAFPRTCGRPAGHDGSHMLFATFQDDVILASMPDKGGGRVTECGAPL